MIVIINCHNGFVHHPDRSCSVFLCIGAFYRCTVCRLHLCYISGTVIGITGGISIGICRCKQMILFVVCVGCLMPVCVHCLKYISMIIIGINGGISSAVFYGLRSSLHIIIILHAVSVGINRCDQSAVIIIFISGNCHSHGIRHGYEIVFFVVGKGNGTSCRICDGCKVSCCIISIESNISCRICSRCHPILTVTFQGNTFSILRMITVFVNCDHISIIVYNLINTFFLI